MLPYIQGEMDSVSELWVSKVNQRHIKMNQGLSKNEPKDIGSCLVNIGSCLVNIGSCLVNIGSY